MDADIESGPPRVVDDDLDATPPEASVLGHSRGWRRSLRGRRKWVHRRLFVAASVVLLLAVVLAVFAPQIAPYSPVKGSLSESLRPPAWQSGGSASHLLGTDQLGRDELSRLIFGTRVSLAVGFAAAAIAALIGVPLGLLAGYLGGWFDTVVNGLLNVLVGFPFVLLALLVAAVVGPSFTNVILILGAVGWPIQTRVVRAQVLELRERDFVEIARAMGYPRRRVIVKHILPGVTSTVLVVGSLQVGQMILSEAFLSFLGLGVQPPTASWGAMLNEGTSLIFAQPWLTIFPGLAIFVIVLAVNLVGDGFRRPGESSESVGVVW